MWGRNARFAEKLAVGQHIDIVGRVQSRNYQKRLDDDTVVTRTAYEVSVGKISIADDSAVSATETSESDVADGATEVGELHAGIQIL